MTLRAYIDDSRVNHQYMPNCFESAAIYLFIEVSIQFFKLTDVISMFLLPLLIHHNHVQYSTLHCRPFLHHMYSTTLYVSCSAILDVLAADAKLGRAVLRDVGR